jgi:hypothetical protein
LVVAGVCLAAPTGGQEPTGPPPQVATSHALDRIRDALTSEPALTLPDDTRRFYLEVVERPRTWQEYMDGSNHPFAITSIVPPSNRRAGSLLGGGGGIDLLGVINSVRRAYREREAASIRRQIDRELQAIEAGRSE